VLCAADDPAADDRLNRMLRRSEFMPFAPTVLEDDAPAILEGWAPDHASSRHMTTTYHVTPAGRAIAPAVVHVDGTARPQVLRAEDNPRYHALLGAYKARTGSGVVLNTSMNVHEEPIVCRPEEALHLFVNAGLDGLLLEGRLVTRRPV
jgi:carbamoyltransferase